MSETVTVTPRFDNDLNGDPVADGVPYTLTARAVAPGNTMISYGAGGDLDDVEFTVFLPLGSVISNGYKITVRGRDCVARVQVWDSAWNTGRGGVIVLAKSTTGKG
jgi:hypothetical protein